MNIPFTHEQFFRIIEQYNASLFPAQLIILILVFLALSYYIPVPAQKAGSSWHSWAFSV